MENSKYWKARSYLYRLDPLQYKDLCHDAYLSYFKSTGKNLFEQDIKTIILVAKRTALLYWRQNKYQTRNGEQQKREFIEFNSGDDAFTAHRVNSITPQHELEAVELLGRFYKLLENTKAARKIFIKESEIIRKILELKLQGYQNDEIAEQYGISKSLVTYYLKRINLNQIKDN